MAVVPGRFSRLRLLQTGVCAVSAIGAIGLIFLGIVHSGSPDDSSGLWMIVAGVFTLLLVAMYLSFTPFLLKMESTITRQVDELRNLNTAMNKQIEALEQVVENTRFSEAAKALAHRDQELEALRATIREDLRAQRWESALYLVEAIERRFGYKNEADRLREEVDDARQTTIQKQLQEAVDMVESHLQSREWDRAQTGIDRLLQALPNSAQVLALQDRMQDLRDQHKQELRLAWDEAVRRSDTDRAIDVLKALDPYISGAEAKELQDSARNVFKEKLLQLGVQFRFAVKEHRWSDALEIGLELVRDFPNARMANEVRDALDTLRERARSTGEMTPT